MIFAKTIDLVLSGRKTQTVRLCCPGDELGRMDNGARAVFSARYPWGNETRRRVRWRVGGIMAVQPERCHKARAQVIVTGLGRIEDPTAVDVEFARREGFDTVDEYLRTWHALHPKHPVQPCWVIGFELVNPAAPALKSQILNVKSPLSDVGQPTAGHGTLWEGRHRA